MLSQMDQKRQANQGNMSNSRASNEDILRLAKQEMARSSLPQFQVSYTLSTIESKLADNQGNTVNKIVAASIKIYKAIVKTIQAREGQIMMVSDAIRNNETSNRDWTNAGIELISKGISDLRACSAKLIKQFGHWLKVVGAHEKRVFLYSSESNLFAGQTNNSISQQNDYISKMLSANPSPIMQFLNSTNGGQQFPAQCNPLLLSSAQLLDPDCYPQQKIVIGSLSKAQRFSTSPPKIMTKSMSESNINEATHLKFGNESSPQLSSRNAMELLKKFKSLAGSPKRGKNSLSVMSRLPTKKRQGNSLRKDGADQYLQKIDTLKEKVKEESPKKVNSVQRANEIQAKLDRGQKVVEKFRSTKIRLLAEIEHDNIKEQNKAESQKIMELTSMSSLSKVIRSARVIQRFEPTLKTEDNSLIKLRKDSKVGSKPALQNLELKKTQSLKKQQLAQISASLNGLKQRIKSTNQEEAERKISTSQSRSKTNNFAIIGPRSMKDDNMSETVSVQESRIKAMDGNFYSSKLKNKERSFDQKDQKEQIQTNKAKEASESSANALNQTNQQAIELKSSQVEDIDRSLIKARYLQLESIVEDIQNENQEKEEKIKHKKSINKNLQTSVLEKRQRIEQLELEVKKYEDPEEQFSERFEESEMKKLEREKSIRVEKFEQDKKAILNEIRETEKKMLEEEHKFMHLKEKEMQLQQQDTSANMEQKHKALIQDMEEKTRKLQLLIAEEQSKSKSYQRELEEQAVKNELISLQLKKQEDLQNLLLAQIRSIVNERKNKAERQKKRKIERLHEQIKELQETHNKVLIEYQRDTQNVNSMFESMRLKNLQIESKLKNKAKNSQVELI